jgi:hypothetical protein
MIVTRFTHSAKPGCREALVEVLKGWVEGSGVSGRVMTPGWADWDKVELVVEWESDEDIDKFWANYDSSQPWAADLHKRLDELRQSCSTNVRWETQ